MDTDRHTDGHFHHLFLLPAGIDPALWEQGKRENPNPKKFFPVVKVGFQELQMQFK